MEFSIVRIAESLILFETTLVGNTALLSKNRRQPSLVQRRYLWILNGEFYGSKCSGDTYESGGIRSRMDDLAIVSRFDYAGYDSQKLDFEGYSVSMKIDSSVLP